MDSMSTAVQLVGTKGRLSREALWSAGPGSQPVVRAGLKRGLLVFLLVLVIIAVYVLLSGHFVTSPGAGDSVTTGQLQHNTPAVSSPSKGDDHHQVHGPSISSDHKQIPHPPGDIADDGHEISAPMSQETQNNVASSSTKASQLLNKARNISSEVGLHKSSGTNQQVLGGTSQTNPQVDTQTDTSVVSKVPDQQYDAINKHLLQQQLLIQQQTQLLQQLQARIQQQQDEKGEQYQPGGEQQQQQNQPGGGQQKHAEYETRLADDNNSPQRSRERGEEGSKTLGTTKDKEYHPFPWKRPWDRTAGDTSSLEHLATGDDATAAHKADSSGRWPGHEIPQPRPPLDAYSKFARARQKTGNAVGGQPSQDHSADYHHNLPKPKVVKPPKTVVKDAAQMFAEAGRRARKRLLELSKHNGHLTSGKVSGKSGRAYLARGFHRHKRNADPLDDYFNNKTRTSHVVKSRFSDITGKSSNIRDGLKLVTGKIPNTRDGLIGTLSNTRNGLTGTLSNTRNGLIGTLSNTRNGLTGTLSNTRNGLTGTLSNTRDGLTSTLSNTRDGLTNTRDGLTGTLSNTRDGLTSTLSNTRDGLTNTRDGLTNTRDGLTGTLSNTRDGLTGTLSNTRDGLLARTSYMDSHAQSPVGTWRARVADSQTAGLGAVHVTVYTPSTHTGPAPHCLPPTPRLLPTVLHVHCRRMDVATAQQLMHRTSDGEGQLLTHALQALDSDASLTLVGVRSPRGVFRGTDARPHSQASAAPPHAVTHRTATHIYSTDTGGRRLGPDHRLFPSTERLHVQTGGTDHLDSTVGLDDLMPVVNVTRVMLVLQLTGHGHTVLKRASRFLAHVQTPYVLTPWLYSRHPHAYREAGALLRQYGYQPARSVLATRLYTPSQLQGDLRCVVWRKVAPSWNG